MIAERIGREAAAALLPSAGTDGIAAAPATGLGETCSRSAPGAPPGQGSNNWVVTGERSSRGKPLLANDPHLLAQQPGAWLEMHLRAPGYEARGVTVPFAPGVLIGTTAHHAWGMTNVTGDVQDLYLERLSDDGTAALFDDAWHPLTMHRGDRGSRERRRRSRRPRDAARPDPRRLPRRRPDPEVVEPASRRRTRFAGWGPNTRSRRRAWSGRTGVELRGVPRGRSCGRMPRAELRLCRCRRDDRLSMHRGLPVRRAGDGTAPVPGWTSEYEWDGFVDFEELPWPKDPDRGYLATANQRIHADAYPHLIGHDFHTPYRARTDRRASRGRATHSVAHVRRDAARHGVDRRSELLPPAAVATESLEHASPRTPRCWDADLRADSAAAAVFEV